MADPTKGLTIEVTTGHCLGGEGHDVYPGTILVAPRDLSIEDALKKVRSGYARIVPDTTVPGPAVVGSAGSDAVTHGDPPVENRDPVVEAPTVAPAPHRGRFRTGGRKTE